MKSIVVREFGPPSVLKLEESRDPQPDQQQVLVKVHAVGVNPVDTYIRAGTYPVKPALPYTPGTDAAGEVVAVGADVSGFEFGDRVYVGGTAQGKLFGAYTSHALCDASQIHRLPNNITYAEGAAVNVPYVTAYRALIQRANLKAGETVLVHGASGGVGIAAVQIAAAFGATVIGTASTPRGQEMVRDQGARHVLNHSKPGYLDELMALTNGKGVDVIVEMLANVNLDNDLRALARFGRIAVVGNRGRIEIDPRLTMAKESTIVGVAAWADEKQLNEIHSYIGAGLARGSLKPVVGLELPLKDAPRAHEEVVKGGSYGKIVLIPQTDF